MRLRPGARDAPGVAETGSATEVMQRRITALGLQIPPLPQAVQAPRMVDAPAAPEVLATQYP